MKEDIKILEEFTESSCCLTSQEEIIECVKNLIKGYRELEESKITYERVRDIQEENKKIVDEKYIPKSKIKEKIEELEKSKNEFKGTYYELVLFYKIQVLQELIKD